MPLGIKTHAWNLAAYRAYYVDLKLAKQLAKRCISKQTARNLRVAGRITG